jgi:predicted nucleic acid-binding Zn ribbon protein
MSLRNTSEITLKEAIEALLRTYKLADKLNEVKLMSAYPKVVGKVISRHTVDLRIKYKILQITVDSAALKHEMTFMREKLIKKLNKSVGIEVIDDIRLI